jgi:hypothetical protein
MRGKSTWFRRPRADLPCVGAEARVHLFELGGTGQIEARIPEVLSLYLCLCVQSLWERTDAAATQELRKELDSVITGLAMLIGVQSSDAPVTTDQIDLEACEIRA